MIAKLVSFQEKTREQRELELIPKVTEAISLGVNVIEDAFEKLDTNIDNSDSDDEDTSYRVDPILEAKVGQLFIPPSSLTRTPPTEWILSLRLR